MKRRANLLCKVVITALLAFSAGSFVAPYTLQAQGAIGQGDPTGATTGTARRHRQGPEEPDARRR